MNRRDVFKAAPAAVLVGALPAAAATTETPIMALFREWQRLTAAGVNPDLSDAEEDRISDARIELENRMIDAKPESLLDAMLQLMAFTDFGGYDQLPSREYHPQLWASYRELVGSTSGLSVSL